MHATVIFVDIRGFTRWSEDIEAFQNIDKFVNDFYKILDKHFSDADLIKRLGDGAMVIEEIKKSITSELLIEIVEKNLDIITHVDSDFEKLCDKYSEMYGCETELRLGWGLVRGGIKTLNGCDDFIGANVNKCARLCNIARPFGIVIERVDFPNLPPDSQYDFVESERKLEGIMSGVKVWVTNEISTKLIPREKIIEKPEVHVAGLCIRIDGNNIEALIAKRNPDRALFPMLYEGCGGQLARSEYFTDGVKRHFSSEMNIKVDVEESIHKFYKITESNEPLIPGVKFLCIYKGGKPRSKNHSEVRWVSEDELNGISSAQFIPGLKDDFIEFIAKFKNDQ